MSKLIRHVKQWNRWRKHNMNPWYHKLLVLLGIVHSPTFWIINEETTDYTPYFTKEYKELGHTIMVRPNSCFFCHHLTCQHISDIACDLNKTYAFSCNNEKPIANGMQGKCPDFIDDEEE